MLARSATEMRGEGRASRLAPESSRPEGETFCPWSKEVPVSQKWLDVFISNHKTSHVCRRPPLQSRHPETCESGPTALPLLPPLSMTYVSRPKPPSYGVFDQNREKGNGLRDRYIVGRGLSVNTHVCVRGETKIWIYKCIRRSLYKNFSS